MNMKVTAVLVIVFALVATLIYTSQQGPSAPPPAEMERQEIDIEQTTEVPRGSTDPVQSDALTSDEEEPEPREEQIAETKAKLDALMFEYNENLKNPEAKKELEAQIALLMDEYNALILPIAVEKVKQTALPKT